MNAMSTLLVASSLLLGSQAQFVDYHNQVEWDNTDLYPGNIVGSRGAINYCGLEDVQQTPISYHPYLIRPCPSPYATLDWTWSKGIVKYEVTNTGTFLNYVPEILPGFEKTVLKNKFVAVPGVHEEYCLSSFHFHYSINSDRGSEHAFDGQFPPAEMHFVHYGCEYGSLGAAAEASVGKDRSKLGVVGVMFEVGPKDNPWFTETLKFLDVLRNAGGSATIDAKAANIFDILPSTGDYGTYNKGMKGDRSYSYGGYSTTGDFGPYYGYRGGLTTPPCTDIVLWHSMLIPVEVSEKQMRAFRTLFNNDTPPSQQAPNFRFLQPQLAKTETYECP